MLILLGSFQKRLEKLYCSYTNGRMLPKKNSFVRANVMICQKYGSFKKGITQERGRANFDEKVMKSDIGEKEQKIDANQSKNKIL